MEPFWQPGTKIIGNQLSEVSKSATNALRGYENRVVGTEMSILALLFWKIWSFYSCWTILEAFWNHFGSPRTKIVGNQLSEVSESATNELRGYENRVVGTEMSILALLVWKIW